jgi:hypothetical protein
VFVPAEDGDTTERTEQDHVIVRHANGAQEHHAQLVTKVDSPDTVTVTNLTPSVATMDANYRLTRIADGTARVQVATSWRTVLAERALAYVDGNSYDVVTDFVADSAAEAFADEIDMALAAGGDLAVLDDGAWNASSWVSGFDLSCCCVSDTQRSGQSGGCLISPRHVLFTEHWRVTGGTVTFLTPDGDTVTRTVTGYEDIGPANASDLYTSDLSVALLDSDATDVTVAKVLPSDYLDYLPAVEIMDDGIAYQRSAACVPMIRVDRNRDAYVIDILSLTGSYAAATEPVDATRQTYYTPAADGDSGSPLIVPMSDGSPLLLGMTSRSGAGSGPNPARWATDINAAMTSLGGGYSLTEADLSGFTDYGS